MSRLSPRRIVNNGHASAEVTHSIASTRFTRYSLGPQLLSAVHLCKLPLEKPRRVVCGYVVLYCGCRARQETNASAVPLTGQAFFQPLSSCLAYLCVQQAVRTVRYGESPDITNWIGDTVGRVLSIPST